RGSRRRRLPAAARSRAGGAPPRPPAGASRPPRYPRARPCCRLRASPQGSSPPKAAPHRGSRLGPLAHAQTPATPTRISPQKELVGEFRTAGRTWRPKGEPVRVSVHDSPSQSQGKAIPYGVYDVGHNRGFVNVGPSHDPPDFAVERLRLWWEHAGHGRYPAADARLIGADSGGSNGTQSRGWK